MRAAQQTGLKILAPDQIPPALITPAGSTVTWFGTDTEARYARQPHPTLGASDVQYTFNSLGYRSPEPPAGRPVDALTLLSVGASEVFGLGVAEADAFPRVLAGLLAQQTGRPVVDVNLGLCGAAMDYVSRTLTSAIGAVRPDIVVFVMPSPVRREHVNDLGRAFLYPNSFSPTWLSAVKNKLKYMLGDPENSQQNSANARLASDANDALNAFRNYATCELMCRRHGVMWLFSAFCDDFVAPIRHLVDADRYVGPGLADIRDAMLAQGVAPELCWARDMGHPGVAPHRRMAELCLQKLQAIHGAALQRLAAAAATPTRPAEFDVVEP